MRVDTKTTPLVRLRTRWLRTRSSNTSTDTHGKKGRASGKTRQPHVRLGKEARESCARQPANAPCGSCAIFIRTIKPYNSGFLRRLRRGINEIYFEECGNPRGKPAVFLHGGPGGGTDPLKMRRFFDPKRYRIVLFDQRWLRQEPPAREPRTPTLRGIWSRTRSACASISASTSGSCSAVRGADSGSRMRRTHPERVTEMVLRGISRCGSELELVLSVPARGSARCFPDLWEQYVAAIPGERARRHDGRVLQAPHEPGPQEVLRKAACRSVVRVGRRNELSAV